MTLFSLLALLITLAALFSYINYKFIKLPTMIGLMLISMLFSLFLVVLGWFGLGVDTMALHILNQIDFNKALLEGMLSFLLFAGALHVNISDLMQEKWLVLTLAKLGVLLSTFLIGTATFYLMPLFGLSLPYLYCLIFGALISPTDPVAVMGILKSAGASKSLETKIVGESLFNDGVGVVVFVALFSLIAGEFEPSFISIGSLFLKEVIGGAVLGMGLGYIAYNLLKQVDNYQVEILITLALVMGGYALALSLHASGPIAMVMSGLLIGNHGRYFAMSQTTRENLDTFWELVDEILNAVLFVLIGLEVLVLSFTFKWIVLGFLLIPVILLVRAFCVGIPVSFLKWRGKAGRGVVSILTWGGLRGGISVALALALPVSPERNLILTITYIIVAFSILVQGTTLKKLIQFHAK